MPNSGAGSSSRPILFRHIPKTAGTSVMERLSRTVGPARSVRLGKGITDSAEDLAAFIGTKRALSGHFSFASIQPHVADVTCCTVLREPVARVSSLYEFWRGG